MYREVTCYEGNTEGKYDHRGWCRVLCKQGSQMPSTYSGSNVSGIQPSDSMQDGYMWQAHHGHIALPARAYLWDGGPLAVGLDGFSEVWVVLLIQNIHLHRADASAAW